ncbi:MAG TPA: helicase-related protein [Allosphingosinicella sp.]|jgi:transcription-repair coupling factor (superfamily II helicase)
MLQDSADTPSDIEGVAGAGQGRRVHAALGPTVARLCAAVEEGDVLAVLCGEQRGEAVAKAAAALTDALVLWYPPSDALPGDAAPASPAVAGQRVAALAALQAREKGRRVLFVTDAAAATQMIAPPAAYGKAALAFAPGDTIDREALPEQLEAIGYFGDDRIDEAGEYALRGGTLDIFPADATRPVRIHLDEDRIGEIGEFDAVSQLGCGAPLERLDIRPAAEPAPGAEPVTLFDHLPQAAVALDPEAGERRDSFIELAGESFGGAKAPLAGAKVWREALAGRRFTELAEDGAVPGRRFVEARRPDRAFLAAVEEARGRGDRVVLAGSARDLRFFGRSLEKRGSEAPRAVSGWREIDAADAGAFLALEVELERGWTAPGLIVIATADVLGSRAQSSGGGGGVNPLEREGAEFHAGDAVIHEDHGIAILRGIERVTTGEAESDAFRLEYAGGGQRLVPVEEGRRLWRYGADADAVTLDKLDGSTWEKRRAELDAALAQTATQLVALAKERAERTAPVLVPPIDRFERFAAGFPYAETADQIRAIEAVRGDLASGKPMDRLVVGDVGYGKTEVALRAAAAVALAGRQVVVVAPTTVLVRQHIETFRKRFARVGLKVAGLSRLTSAAEAREVKKGLADGSVSVLVGTKMVAGKTVMFHDLGLVVIDEEQRFGAADKAKLRGLAGEGGHVLTLTATPIPRTLQSALVGLQELSLITTPPARRLPTRTHVSEFTSETVRAALLRENRRGGQSFVVVPRIEDMNGMAEQLARLVPQLSVRRAHGKMAAAEIDEEMVRFGAGDGDVLLATNIIEAGLDIPRANTMIVWRADLFGLAQLHQLRGRVGRGRSRGYVVLLTETGAEVAPATLKRLRTMEVLDQLGAGFAISARDLDLRGAGDLLGEEQAGHLKLIGVGLYQHLLEQAIRSARGEDADAWLPELHLGLTGKIPEEWVPEEDLRVNLYLRIARLASAGEEEALAAELEDRFGTLPEDAARLFALAAIRRLARDAKIARVDAGPAAIALTPRRGARIAAKANGLEKKDNRLLLRKASEGEDERLELVRELLEALAG